MTRILLVCPEPLGHGQPAGIGIRFTEIARVLLADQHAITVLSPDGGTVDGCAAHIITPENILRASESHDVAIVQGHVANDFFAHARPIPTVIDLYDPFIVENLHYYAERGPEVFAHDHATLVGSLVRGDLFLCASEAQRLFWLGMLLAIGRLNPIVFADDPHLDSLVRIAPFGVQPPRAEVMRNLDAPSILFGGIYDWYDPMLAIDAVALARQSIPNLTMTFTRHPNPDITPQGKTAEAMQYVKSKGYGAFIRFEPWAPYDQRASFFERFTLALLTFRQSLETDLSMRTRVYDYLWCGLPIVTSSAPGTDEVLTRYGCGVIVRDDEFLGVPRVPRSSSGGVAQSAEELRGTGDSRGTGAARGTATRFASELRRILRDRDLCASMVRGARAFVDDHQWPRTLEPLRAFCDAPAFESTKSEFTVPPRIAERPPTILDRIRRRLRA